jgi:hypothetical protein
VVHNFFPVSRVGGGEDLLAASYEGLGWINRPGKEPWQRIIVNEANQTNPNANRGASEVKAGTIGTGRNFISTIEPWHGFQVVVYTQSEDFLKEGRLLGRHVIDESLRWGHAVWCADLDGDKNDEIIVGVRDDKSDKPGERRGVRLYKALDDKGTKWARHILDDGGIAVEDLAAADLDGDGRIDIVAVGRQTHNIRIYWNKGLEK